MGKSLVIFQRGMIKIHHSSDFIETLAERHYKTLLEESPYNVKNKLETGLKKLLDKDTKGFLLILIKQVKTILKGKPEELEEFVMKYHHLYKAINDTNVVSEERKQEVRVLNDVINEAFNYGRFSRKYSGWGAYALTNSLNIEVCPYCNISYSSTVQSKEGKTRSKLDHYLIQRDFPYLRVSFYNLIPCCQTCNSDIKGRESFSISTHVHPYIEGYEDSLLFQTGISDKNYSENIENSINISLIPGEGFNERDDCIIRARKNIKDFLIEKLYNVHKHEAAKFIEKKRNYDDVLKKFMETYSSSKGQKLWTGQEIDQKIMEVLMEGIRESSFSDFCFDKSCFHRRPLSKFYRDIAREVGLI
jgi:hypothetical protein